MADVADAAGDDYQVRTPYALCLSCHVSSNEDDIALELSGDIVYPTKFCHLPLQKYASDAVETFAEKHHRTDSLVPGGGTAVKESLLIGTMHLATQFKRPRAKPYLTATEAEKEKTEK
eukprot:6082502-Pleurochrysis_carterae.AAC.1